jgi:hypothetical protein
MSCATEPHKKVSHSYNQSGYHRERRPIARDSNGGGIRPTKCGGSRIAKPTSAATVIDYRLFRCLVRRSVPILLAFRTLISPSLSAACGLDKADMPCSRRNAIVFAYELALHAKSSSVADQAQVSARPSDTELKATKSNAVQPMIVLHMNRQSLFDILRHRVLSCVSATSTRGYRRPDRAHIAEQNLKTGMKPVNGEATAD